MIRHTSPWNCLLLDNIGWWGSLAGVKSSDNNLLAPLHTSLYISEDYVDPMQLFLSPSARSVNLYPTLPHDPRGFTLCNSIWFQGPRDRRSWEKQHNTPDGWLKAGIVKANRSVCNDNKVFCLKIILHLVLPLLHQSKRGTILFSSQYLWRYNLIEKCLCANETESWDLETGVSSLILINALIQLVHANQICLIL